VDSRRYEEKDAGGFGGASDKFEIVIKIVHDGEVNKARYMPQKPNIIATKSPSGDCLIFDYTKHGSTTDDPICRPQLRLTGHRKEGYGLSWSPLKEGYLASGAEDKVICIWDVNSKSSTNSLQPLHTIQGHEAEVEDVSWNPHHEFFLGSVGDDKAVNVWDIRSLTKSSLKIENAHGAEVNAISFNSLNEFIFATGGSDRIVNLWDIRNPKVRLHGLIGHADSVYSLSWNPHNETILASTGTDRRVNVWDLSKIGDEQLQEDAEDGPPELLFIHGGHTSKVSDLSWNFNEPWVMASVADNNIVQLWQMAENIYNDTEKETPKDSELE